jgi:hypothetical protein
MARLAIKSKQEQKKPHSQRKEQPDTKVITMRIPTDKYNKLKAAGGTIKEHLERAVIERIDKLSAE